MHFICPFSVCIHMAKFWFMFDMLNVCNLFPKHSITLQIHGTLATMSVKYFNRLFIDTEARIYRYNMCRKYV